MVYKVLLDANVIMDFALVSRDGTEDAQQLFEAIAARQILACTTPAIIYMVSYFLRKEASGSWIRGMWVSLLDYVEVIELSHTFALQAIYSNFADLEDALQYFAALQHRCTHFISSNKGLKKAATTQLPVLTPKQILSLLK